MSTVLVTGATGNTGVPLLAGLATREGVTVRAMMRRADGSELRDGVRPVVADFDTPETILRSHAAVERRVVELGLRHTFLRPNLFFHGLYAMAGLIAATGRFVASIGDAKVSAIDVRDIADVAVAALTDEVAPNRTLTLTGPRAVTHAEMAQALSEGQGREIGFDDIDPAAFAQLLGASCRPGRSRARWKTRRTTPAARRRRTRPRSRRSPVTRPATCGSSPTTAPTTSAPLCRPRPPDAATTRAPVAALQSEVLGTTPLRRWMAAHPLVVDALLAALVERLRIARDLHDVVAHHIAVINVRASVASHLIRSDPEQAVIALGHVREAGRVVLEEITGLLGLLRADEPSGYAAEGRPGPDTAPAPRLADLPRLVEEARRSGLLVTTQRSGTPMEFGADGRARRPARRKVRRQGSQCP